MSIDLRHLSDAELSDLHARCGRIEELRARLSSSLVRFGAPQTEGSMTLVAAVGHLSYDRLVDLDLTATCLLRLLFLDGLVFGEQPLEGLAEQALLERLGEVLRVATEKGIFRAPADGLDEAVHLPADLSGSAVGVSLDLVSQEPGDEMAPDVGDLDGFVAVERDYLVRGHREPPVRATPPP